jgi:ferredoxin
MLTPIVLTCSARSRRRTRSSPSARASTPAWAPLARLTAQVAVEELLAVLDGSLHVERFVAKPLTEPVLAEPFEVHFKRSDLTLTVPVDRSILSVADEAGVQVLSSCGEGTCGTCETPVLDGVPDHRDSVLDAEQRAAGDCMMICVSRSCLPRLVLDL